MTVGDVVTFVWQGYRPDGTARPVVEMATELLKEHVGQVLEFEVLKNHLTVIKDVLFLWCAFFFYGIEYCIYF